MHETIVSWIRRTACIVSLAALPLAANAMSCPGDAACNSYTATYTSVDSDTWQVRVDVGVGDYALTGNYLLSALAIKNMTGSPISNASLFSAPSGDPFNFYAGELSNGGGICGNDSNPGTKMCAWAGDGKGATLVAGQTLSFIFQFDAATIGDSLHLKYQYLEYDKKKGQWKKSGSLGSFDIPLVAFCANGNCEPDPCANGSCEPPEPCTNGNCGNVPLPASTALVGIGLVAIGFARGRRRGISPSA